MRTRIDLSRRASQLSTQKYSEQILLLKADNQSLIHEITSKNSQISHLIDIMSQKEGAMASIDSRQIA